MTSVVRVDEVLPGVPRPTHPVARVGVVVSLNFPGMDETLAALVRRFTRVALASLHSLDATFELFDTSAPLPDARAVRDYHGLLLLGGGDIDACHYDASLTDVPNSYGTDSRADNDAFAAIAAAERAELPILGICRGAQLINVHRGGTIIADIEDFSLHRGGPEEPVFLDELVSILPGTRLQSILGVEQVLARSGHHQAVDAIGSGLVPSARALDGIVEGIEDPTRWIIGVQWHPEDDDGPVEDRLRLFRSFVEACAAHRAQRRYPDEHPFPARALNN